MKLKNVKHGQRVVLKVDKDLPKAGDEGTIVIDESRDLCADSTVWVHFDRNVGGWGDYRQNIPSGHGWACKIKDLKRLK